MKKLVTGLTVLLLLFSLVACGQKNADAEGRPDVKEEETGELTYIVTNWPNFPGDVTGVSRFLIEGGQAWLCCQENTDQVDEDGEEITNAYIATMEPDGSGFKRLSDTTSFYPLDIAIDAQGHIWSIGKSEAALELVQLSNEGSIIKSISLSGIVDEKIPLSGAADFYLSCDGEGNICVTARYSKTYSYLFDAEGNYLFSLENEGNPLTTITTGEGKIAVCSSQDGGKTYSLIPIDMNRRAWGEKTALGTASMVYGGAGQYDYYLYDSSDFYGCYAETDARDQLFNWSKLGLSTGDTHVCTLEDGRLAVVSASFNQTGLGSYEYCYVEQGIDNRTVLTMLSLQPDSSLLEAVAQFNKTNSNYKVDLNTYFSSYEDVSDSEWEKALLKYNTEMISGNVPDIIDLNHMPIEAYSNRGLLEDLYPYLKNDPSIREEDYFDHIFDTLSINGRLPYVTNSVLVQTIFADSRIVGAKEGWTTAEFINFLDQNGDKAVQSIKPSVFLEIMVKGSDQFVDWTDGVCHFDSEEFIELLELSKRVSNGQQLIIVNGIADNQVTAAFVSAHSIYDVAQYNTLFSGNVNPIGYPNENGTVCHMLEAYSKIGISASGAHKDGAWEFARSFLEERQQDSSFFFPIRKASFEKIASAAMKGNSVWSYVYERKLVQEDVDLARNLLNSVRYCQNDNSLIEIVTDGAAAYFEGDKSAKDAANAIQMRAQLYVGEQK